MEKAEIIIYKEETSDSDFQIEVRDEEDTVWITQTQMFELFNVSKQNISLHINNIFKEGELQRNSVVKEYLTTAEMVKNTKQNFITLMYLRILKFI